MDGEPTVPDLLSDEYVEGMGRHEYGGYDDDEGAEGGDEFVEAYGEEGGQPEYDPLLFVVGVEADAGIPAYANLRRSILSTLKAQDVVNASKLHEHWYAASTDPLLWRGLYTSAGGASSGAAGAGTKPSPQGSSILLGSDLSFGFPSPVMYQLIEEVATSRSTDLDLLCADDAGRFIKGLGPIFTMRGCWLYSMVTLHVLTRVPSFVLGPLDPPARHDALLEPMHRYYMLLTQVLTAQTTCPRPSALPWLLSLYEWVATSPSAAHMGFHKAMLAPASYLIRSEVCPPLPHHVRSVVMLTGAIIERFVKGRYLVFPSGSYAGSPAVLAGQDPRNAYSIYIHVLLKFPEFRGLVTQEVASRFGDVGIFELECARARVMLLLGAASLRSKEMLETAVAEAAPVEPPRQ